MHWVPGHQDIQGNEAAGPFLKRDIYKMAVELYTDHCLTGLHAYKIGLTHMASAGKSINV